MSTGYAQLLEYLWRSGHFTGRLFDAVAGESVEVVSTGECGEHEGVWHGAEIVVDGERRRGDVIIGDAVSETAVLRVVDCSRRPVFDISDRLVPQIEYTIENDIADCYDRLRDGAAEKLCAATVAELDSLRRTDLFTKLSVVRLERKLGGVMDVFESSGGDWNQTFYVMLLRSMGGNRNAEAFAQLASRATFAMVSREKSSPERVEALLLGTSGFLHAADEKDAYTLGLESEFRHLANKHSIVPLKPALWNLGRIYPPNHPAVRLAQIAALVSKRDFLLDTMLECRSAEDVEKLFCAEASEYWQTRYRPGVESRRSPKRIGTAKAHLIGINLVVPLMFAYGKRTGNENLCERALDLLETIPAEKNEKLAIWSSKGCVPANGFESQALLELHNEFCCQGRCTRCQIGRAEIKKASQHLSSAGNG